MQIFPVQFSLGGKRERGGVRTGFLFIFVETEIFKRLFPAGGEMAGATRHEKKMKKLRINTMTKDEEWREREPRKLRLFNQPRGTRPCDLFAERAEHPVTNRRGNESKRNGCWKFRCGGENRDEKFQSYPRNLFRYSSVFTILIFDSR